MEGQTLSAQRLDTWLAQGRFPFPLDTLEAAFRFDSHALWHGRRRTAAASGVREKWEELLAYTNQGRRGHRPGTAAGSEARRVAPAPESQYGYRRFLQRFAVPREEVELDAESFDYILYRYGMEHYGNLSLIEPLEYKEVSRLEELVIAIDTSGSCSKETVQRFLGETCRILEEKENFFRRMKVYLIQCDCLVQSVALIHSLEEWRQRAQEIVIQGRGGTDFTPVFRYVEKLRAEKALRGPRALLYFTDGDGVYPRQAPEYETAFVFLKKSETISLVPRWTATLVLDTSQDEKGRADR